MSSWAKLAFKVRAKIGGVEFKDVVRFGCTFEGSSVPSAGLVVAVGADADGNPATIHANIDKIVSGAAAEVFLTVIPQGSDNLKEPLLNLKDEVRIWLGRVAGVAINRSLDEASVLIQLTHWLEDLNGPSSLNSVVHPHSSGDFAHGAIYPGLRTKGGEAGTRTWVPLIDDKEIAITDGALETDLWKNILHPWLLRMAQADIAKVDTFPGESTNGNVDAQAALARMTNASKFAVPLAMNLTKADGGAIAAGVRNALTSESFQSWVHTTLWGKLIGEWVPSYFFTVIPRIEDALVVPFAGSLRTPYIAVNGDEYSINDHDHTHSSSVNLMTQQLRAVGVWHAATMDLNGNGAPQTEDVGYKTIAGWYQSSRPSGMVLIKESPNWLQNAVSPGTYAADSADADRTNGVGHAAAPGGGAPPKKTAPGAVVKSLKNILDNFAHHWYTLEQLKGRTLEISGKLRFDIAPGSTLKIQGGAGKTVGNDQLNVIYFATVLRTSIMLDCENQQAGTAFSLAHVRTAAENASNDSSVETPPLYTKAWTGAPLADVFVA